MNKPKIKLIVAAIAAMTAELVYPSLIGVAHAIPPQFTRAVLRWDTHRSQVPLPGTGYQGTGVTTCLVPSSNIVVPTNTVYKLEIVFPVLPTGQDFTVNTTAANWVTDTSFSGEGPINGLAMTAMPNISATASAVTAGTANTTGSKAVFDLGTGSTSTFTLAAGTQYCFHFTGTNTLTNSDPVPSGATIDGTVRINNNSSVVQQETNYSTSIIGDDTITVTAIVPPNFKLSMSGNADTFGTTSRLTTGAINVSNGIDFTVETNAKGGWIAWIKDTDRTGGSSPNNVSGLYSATANYTIRSGPVGGAGTTVGDGLPEVLPLNGKAEGYLLDVDVLTDATGGCVFPDNTGNTPPGSLLGSDTDYDADGGVTGTTPNQVVRSGGTISHIFQPIVECNGTPPATSNGDVVRLTEKVTIAGGTPAGSDYTDILTLVAAGQF